jgi:hypothetical protein
MPMSTSTSGVARPLTKNGSCLCEPVVIRGRCLGCGSLIRSTTTLYAGLPSLYLLLPALTTTTTTADF